MTTAHSFALGPLIVLALLLAVSLIGLILFIRCWRGKRIDDHPLCRRCRYDLIGTPEPRKTCPECGTDLTDSHALVIGSRKRITHFDIWQPRERSYTLAGAGTQKGLALLYFMVYP